IFAADDGGFANRGMRDKSAFHFRRAEPPAVDFEEIVGAARVPEVAVFILVVLVAGAEPGPDERGFGSLVLIPIARADGIAFDEEITVLMGTDCVALFLDDLGFGTGNGLAAGAGSRLAWASGNDHLQGFGGT